MSADTPNSDQKSSPSAPSPSATTQQDGCGLLISLGFLAAVAILVVIVARHVLPVNPGRLWVASTASNMIWLGVAIVLPGLIGAALYRWQPRLRAAMRYMLRHFGFVRMWLLALVILLPPSLAVLVYGIVLLHSPSLWNQPFAALLCGPLVAGYTLGVLASLARMFSAQEIREATGDIERLING